jgi:hypothetical protein
MDKKAKSLALLSLALQPQQARRDIVRAALFGGGLSLIRPAVAAEPQVVDKRVVVTTVDADGKETQIVLPVIDERQKQQVSNFAAEPPPMPPTKPTVATTPKPPPTVLVVDEKPQPPPIEPKVAIAQSPSKVATAQSPSTTTMSKVEDFDVEALREKNLYPDLLKQVEQMRAQRNELTIKIGDGENEARKLREDISMKNQRLSKVEEVVQQRTKQRSSLDQDLLESETSLYKILESSSALLEKMKSKKPTGMI